MAKSKFHNIKVKGFDSKKEAKRYLELMAMYKNGEISKPNKQVPFELIPSQYVGKKCVERAVKYIADFTYYKDNELVVEDVKSVFTKSLPVYILKRKLMLFIHKIQIKEV